MLRAAVVLWMCISFWQCQPVSPTATPAEKKLTPVSIWPTDSLPRLSNYWKQGKAEISRFDLQQHRYRDVHPGEAVLVMVTEDFLTDQQVKNDRYENPNSIPVLKTNLFTRFTTGIYDYSIMTSAFTPVNAAGFPMTLKTTHSSQDWCGQTFMQVNWAGDAYKVQVRSYFESEGDVDTTVAPAVLEDELWNRIRMQPEQLPTGKVRMLPSATVARLLHIPFSPIETNATLGEYAGNDFAGPELRAYKVVFPSLQRTLEIVFEAQAPHLIAGWTDAYPGFDGQIRRTVAKRTHLILDNYWTHNSLNDKGMRNRLGLE
jgi:hypothetical protein